MSLYPSQRSRQRERPEPGVTASFQQRRIFPTLTPKPVKQTLPGPPLPKILGNP